MSLANLTTCRASSSSGASVFGQGYILQLQGFKPTTLKPYPGRALIPKPLKPIRKPPKASFDPGVRLYYCARSWEADNDRSGGGSKSRSFGALQPVQGGHLRTPSGERDPKNPCRTLKEPLAYHPLSIPFRNEPL